MNTPGGYKIDITARSRMYDFRGFRQLPIGEQGNRDNELHAVFFSLMTPMDQAPDR